MKEVLIKTARDEGGLTLKDTGSVVGISVERVRQILHYYERRIEYRTYLKIKEQMESEDIKTT